MNWDQSYSVPPLESLLEKLAGITGTQLLIDHLEAKGLKITDVEDVVLVEGMHEDIKGTKIRLSDGRVYIPKLVERFTANGNYGNDIYEWWPVGVATPEELEAAEADLLSYDNVIPAPGEYVDEDEADNLYGGCGDDGCGCGW